ncbi:MAG: phage tail assembly protein [Planktomarina sp.]
MTNNKSLVSFTLSKAVEIDGKKVTEIKLRQPVAGEMRGVNLSQVILGHTDTMLEVLPRITMPPLTTAQLAGEDIDFKDFTGMCNAVVSNFFGNA